MSHPKLKPNQLGSKQDEFSLMLSCLLVYATLLSFRTGKHYSLRIGEVQRTEEQARRNARNGTGIALSLHTMKLAVDIHLVIDGVYQHNSEAYRPLGEYWKSIGGAWGGDFTKPDGNHFSNAFRGIK